jgi:hypothetical protein
MRGTCDLKPQLRPIVVTPLCFQFHAHFSLKPAKICLGKRSSLFCSHLAGTQVFLSPVAGIDAKFLRLQLDLIQPAQNLCATAPADENEPPKDRKEIQ